MIDPATVRQLLKLIRHRGPLSTHELADLAVETPEDVEAVLRDMAEVRETEKGWEI